MMAVNQYGRRKRKVKLIGEYECPKCKLINKLSIECNAKELNKK